MIFPGDTVNIITVNESVQETEQGYTMAVTCPAQPKDSQI